MTNKRSFIEKHIIPPNLNLYWDDDFYDKLEKELLEDIERDNLQIVNNKDDENASYEMNGYGSFTTKGTVWRDGFMEGVKWLMHQQIKK